GKAVKRMSSMIGMTGKADLTHEGVQLPSAAAALQQSLREALESVRADAVFGRPIERGETIVVPCAEVMIGLGMGGGVGTGRNTVPEADRETEPSTRRAAERETSAGTGEGMGGGGGGRGRPIAAIVISRDGVRVEPILDVTKVALAGITTGAFMIFWLARLGVGRRRVGVKGPSLRQLKRELKV